MDAWPIGPSEQECDDDVDEFSQGGAKVLPFKFCTASDEVDLVPLSTQFFHSDYDDRPEFDDSFHCELAGTANGDAEKDKTSLTRV